MKLIIVIFLIYCGLTNHAQKNITGTIVDFENKVGIQSAIVLITYNSDKDTILCFSDSIGRFSVTLEDSIVDYCSIHLYQFEYVTSIIYHVTLDSKSTDLCQLYMYLKGMHWSGYISKKFLGITVKKIPSVGGVTENYLDKNKIDEKITLDYFCNQTIIGETNENGVLIIDLEKNKK